tara:strand:- start:3546 stop:3797 length:252 start_codon:yes stop_codon:yes gene_type:complete
MKRLILVLTLLVSVFSSTTVFAQEERKPGEIESYDLGEERIEGKIRKPEVLLIIAPEQFKYEDLSLKQSFVDLILSDARSNPF